MFSRNTLVSFQHQIRCRTFFNSPTAYPLLRLYSASPPLFPKSSLPKILSHAQASSHKVRTRAQARVSFTCKSRTDTSCQRPKIQDHSLPLRPKKSTRVNHASFPKPVATPPHLHSAVPRHNQPQHNHNLNLPNHKHHNPPTPRPTLRKPLLHKRSRALLQRQLQPLLPHPFQGLPRRHRHPAHQQPQSAHLPRRKII